MKHTLGLSLGGTQICNNLQSFSVGVSRDASPACARNSDVWQFAQREEEEEEEGDFSF